MEEFFPDDISIRAALHGENQRKALAGEDFNCKYCNALNSALSQCCNECGADKETGTKPWKTTDQTATLDVETGIKTIGIKHEVAIGLENATPQQRVDFKVMQAAAPASPSYDDVPPTGGYTKWKKSQQARSWWPYIIALGVALFGMSGWLLFRTKVVRAQVTSTHWDKQVFIDKYQVFRREGFDQDPDGFNVRYEGQRQHHIDFHVLVGHHWDKSANPYDCIARPSRASVTQQR